MDPKMLLTLGVLYFVGSTFSQDTDYQGEYDKSMQLINSLHDAAGKNDVAGVTSALETDPTIINTRNSNSLTALQLAVKSQSIDVVKLLLARGANNGTDQTTPDGFNILLNAVFFGKADLVDVILNDSISLLFLNKTGPSPNQWAPLHGAVKLGKLSVVKRLLAKGANTETTDAKGRTPLILAVQEKQQQSIVLLLAYNANIKATDSDGLMAIHYAAQQNYVEILKLLLADSRMTADIQTSYWSKSRTPLHVATASPVDTRDAMNVILGKGANINGRDSGGNTALSIAAANGYLDKINFLIQHNVLLDCIQNSTVACGKDAISAAILGENDGSDGCRDSMVDTVEFLLSNGFSTRSTNFNNHICEVMRLASKNPTSRCPIIWLAQLLQSFFKRDVPTKVVCSYQDCGNRAVTTSRTGARHSSADPYDFRVCLDKRPDIRAALKFLNNVTASTPVADSSAWTSNRTIAMQNMKCAPTCSYLCAPQNDPYWTAAKVPGVDDDLVVMQVDQNSQKSTTTSKPSGSGARRPSSSGSRSSVSGSRG